MTYSTYRDIGILHSITDGDSTAQYTGLPLGIFLDDIQNFVGFHIPWMEFWG